MELHNYKKHRLITSRKRLPQKKIIITITFSVSFSVFILTISDPRFSIFLRLGRLNFVRI